ncbi:MAG: nitrous oxide reductase family maturation protein NosD [Myxococcota bacterium]
MKSRALLIAAAVCFVAAVAFPFWKMTLLAPQYPDGLKVTVGVFGLAGDVREINGLNHYIGMAPLEEAAVVEMAIAPYGMVAFVILCFLGAFYRRKWLDFALLVPAGFPLIFMIDVSFWLWYFGNHLDPHAPLTNSVPPFTPLVLFWSHVGQFKTYAMVQAGFTLSTIGSVLVLIALALRWRPSARAGAPSRLGAAAGLLALLMVFASGGDARAFDLQAGLDGAARGAEVRVPAGVYRGNFVVRKPLILLPEGPPGSAILEGGGKGHILRVAAPDVTVRDMAFRGTGDSNDGEDAAITVLAPRAHIEGNLIDDALFGIYLRGAPGSVVRRNRIRGKNLPMMRRGDGIKLWQSASSVVEANDIRFSRDLIVWYSDHVLIAENSVRDSRYGIHFMYSMDNVIERNVLMDNRVGSYLMYSKRLVMRNNVFARNRGPSGYGAGMKEIDGLELVANRFVANRVGLYLDDSPSDLTLTHHVHDNLFAYNDIGVAFLPNVVNNVFSRNSFVENNEQVRIRGGGFFKGNAFTDEGRGNYWSDYVGWDAGRDGVGDVAYGAASLFGSWLVRDDRLRLFRIGLASQAIDFAARAFPAFRPRARIVDRSPLIAPPVLGPGPALPRPAGGGPLIGLLLAVSAGVLLLARAQRPEAAP